MVPELLRQLALLQPAKAKDAVYRAAAAGARRSIIVVTARRLTAAQLPDGAQLCYTGPLGAVHPGMQVWQKELTRAGIELMIFSEAGEITRLTTSKQGRGRHA